MKRLFLIFIMIFSLTLSGCFYSQNNNQNNLQTPPPTIGDANTGTDFDAEDDQQNPKKQYAVSLTNGLRIRSQANTSAQVYGYLDKNDAVLLLGEKNGFYQTVYKEKTAFVSKQYCSIMEIDTAGEKQEKAIDLGCTLLGFPYVWGSQRYHWGNGKLNSQYVHGEFDCSAFVQYIYYKSNSTILDVTTRTQVNNGTEVSKSNLSRGDLMFFTNESRQYKTGTERIGHVGIYLGNNYILHTASDHAVIEPISSIRWRFYITARRVL